MHYGYSIARLKTVCWHRSDAVRTDWVILSGQFPAIQIAAAICSKKIFIRSNSRGYPFSKKSSSVQTAKAISSIQTAKLSVRKIKTVRRRLLESLRLPIQKVLHDLQITFGAKYTATIGYEQTKGMECFLGFSRHSWWKEIS